MSITMFSFETSLFLFPANSIKKKKKGKYVFHFPLNYKIYLRLFLENFQNFIILILKNCLVNKS